MSRRLNCLGILFAVLLATGACLPVTSKSPVGTTVGYKPDPQLTGIWQARSNDPAAYFAFFPQADGSTKVVMLEPSAAGDKGGWTVFDLRTTTLGADHYMDASGIESDGKPVEPKLEHIPVLYSFAADGSLALYLMDEDAVKEAIRTGRIAGTIEPGQYGDIVLTATPAALDAFLETPAGRAVFGKTAIVLARVK